MSYIGVDLGTSAVKAVLVDAQQRVLATATHSLSVQTPHPLWSEQDPESWVAAALAAIAELGAASPAAYRACAAIGLSGQMHGAVLLDETDKPLRPCILWNDGRAAAACAALEKAVPESRAITGNIAMSGFTAPKLVWVRDHEPDIFRRTRRVLLPKAYLRLALSGEAIEDMSDASGTLWLDVGRRAWSDAMLAACGLDRSFMPRLVEGSAPAGRLLPQLSQSLGFDRPPLLAGGAGDNAAGAIGLGAVNAGDTFLSLGTSGVLWRTTGRFAPRAESAVHAFCHALPALWHQMSVHLSAAASLKWWARIAGRDEAALLAELPEAPARPSPALFTPYLSGERTPHNDPHMRGTFARLGHDVDRADLTQAVLEGVAFAFRDGKAAMESDGARITQATAIGGGSRSHLWLSILASVLEVPIQKVAGGEASGAFGAARLARLASTGEAPAAICLPPPRDGEPIAPDPRLVEAYAEAYARWRRAAAFSMALERPIGDP